MSPAKRFPTRIFLSVPHMEGTERAFVQEAFETNWVSTAGPHLTALEAEFEEYAKRPAVALSSGTAALHLGLKLLGLKPGGEVVVPTLTFAAGCNPVLYEHGRPVFVDSERQSWNMDPNLLEDLLKKRAERGKTLPQVVTVVHLFGQSADLDAIVEVCNRFEIPLLEDAAESLGATYKGEIPGTFGDVGIFSLNGNKIITSSGGGLLVARQKEWVDKARYWSTQARDPGLDYLHSEVGYNYRMSNVLAGIARGQLEVLEKRVEQRRAIAFRYRDALSDVPGIELMPQAPWGRHTNWLSCFLVNEREFGLSARELIAFLDAANVDARPVWKPLHTQKLYAGYEIVGGAVAEELNRHGLCLPSSTNMSDEQQQFVIDRIREAAMGKS